MNLCANHDVYIVRFYVHYVYIVELPKSEPGNFHKCLVFLLICIHIGYWKFLSLVGIKKTLGNFFY